MYMVNDLNESVSAYFSKMGLFLVETLFRFFNTNSEDNPLSSAKFE